MSVSLSPFPDQRFAIRDLLADGGRVVMTWTWTATHQGDLPGFPATGRRIEMSGATVYYVDGDRFTGHWQITDRLGVYAQLRQGAAEGAGGGSHGSAWIKEAGGTALRIAEGTRSGLS